MRPISGKPRPRRRFLSKEEKDAIKDTEYNTMYDRILDFADKFERNRVRRESIEASKLRELATKGDLTVMEQAKKGEYQCKDGMCMALGDQMSDGAVDSNIYAAENPDEAYRENMEEAGLTKGIDRKLRMLAQGMLDRRQQRYEKLQDRRRDLNAREYAGDPRKGNVLKNPFYDNINAMRARNIERRTRVLDEKFPLEKANPTVRASF